MLKVLIVDDEENVREAIEQMVTGFVANVLVCGSCATVAEAEAAIKLQHPDIVLLDVEIGKENGFDLLKHFVNPDFKVIFITAYQKYAVQAFRFSAIDYLLKPVDPDLLAESIMRVSQAIDKEKTALKIDTFLHNIEDIPKNQKKVILKTADNIHVVSLNEIVYCEADRSYTKFYLTDKSRIMVSHTMGDYEEMFEDYGFLRIHHSYLLNLDYLRRFEKSEGGKVILKDGTELPVASRKKDQLLQRLSRL